MEKSLFIIKPDAVKKKHIGDIIKIIEINNINIINIIKKKITLKEAETLYNEHKNKNFYLELIQFIISSDSIILLLQGDNVIRNLRKLIGNTNFQNSINSIRYKFATNLTKNAVHASDSFISAQREINIFFKNNEK